MAERGDRRERARDDQRAKLSSPSTGRRLRLPRLRRPAFDSDTFGRFAEDFARFMGTARFLIWMTVIIVVWLGWNTWGPESLRIDPLPYMFLTLILSLQASYAAPLILLAQNRQEARDRISIEEDRRQTAQTRADMDYLAREIASLRMNVGELATREFIRGELRRELRESLGEDDERKDARRETRKKARKAD